MDNIFLQFALVLSLSCGIGYLAYRLKLPLVVAYLLSGVSLGLLTFFDFTHSGIFEFLPEIGIAFVLFLIGMELDLRELRSLGKPIVAGTLVEVIFSTLAGYTIASALGFSNTESMYVGIGLSFSSTVVVIKLLLEKHDLASLYGKLSIGILLLEDIIAIAVLMAIAVGSSVFGLGLQESFPLITLVVKAVGLFLATYLLSKYVLERIFKAVAGSVELLFLTALTWCFLFTTLATISGFSVVIGAFLAGVALASSSYKLQIEGRIKPLRDFFVTLFFVYLGSQANIQDFFTYWPAILLFAGFALIIKPLLFILVLGIFGFRKHTMFQTALSLSSISEFSLIVLLLGVKSNLVSPTALSVMAGATVLSVIASSLLITYSRKLYKTFSPFAGFFEHKSKVHAFEVKENDLFEDHVIIIGADRVGGPIVKFLKEEKVPFIVLDINPHIVEKLRADGLHALYGDIGDPEILDNLSLEQAKLIISTAADLADNELLLAECRRRKSKATIVARANEPEYVKLLEKMGAEYVIVPELVSGDYLANQLKLHWPRVKFRPV